MTLGEKRIRLAQQLGKASIDVNSVRYKNAQRAFERELAAAEQAQATGKAVAGAGPAVSAGVLIATQVAGGVALAGSATGGSAFATAAAISASAGPIGLIASGILLGIAGGFALAGAARKGKATAEAAAAQHGQVGKEWGRAYLGYWKVAEKKDPFKIYDKADALIEQIERVKAKRQTKKRKKKLERLRLNASALASVLLELGTGVEPPAEDAIDSAEEPPDVSEEPDEPSGNLPKALIGLSLLRLLL